MNGHLIFQTGTNHNITFRSTGGGYVNIDGESVQQLASLVRGGAYSVRQGKGLRQYPQGERPTASHPGKGWGWWMVSPVLPKRNFYL